MKFWLYIMKDIGTVKWFVMRDLKRRHALRRAYQELMERGFEVFTPMRWTVKVKRGVRMRQEEPIIADLLFVRSAKDPLDRAVANISTLQYRYRLGHSASEPTVVRDTDMERFINAVRNSHDTRYYLPEEIKSEMYGKEIRVVGGPFDGYTGRLLSLRGSKTKRLLVELPGFITAAVEVSPDYIQFISEN